MKKVTQYIVLFLSILSVCPAYPAGRGKHFFNDRFNQALLACAAGGICWKMYTYYWYRHYLQIQEKAKAYLERLGQRYADIFTMYNNLASDTEQNKYRTFSAFILKEDPSDKQFSGFLERIQRSITKIDEYLKALPQTKDYETIRESLELMKKKITEIKTLVLRFNESAQLERSLQTVTSTFTQEFAIVNDNSSPKQKKRAVKDIILKSKSRVSDLRYVAYDQKIASYLLSLRRCASFSIFKPDTNYGTQHAQLQKYIKDLEQLQTIVHSCAIFQAEEQIQRLRDQVKELQDKIQKLLAHANLASLQAYQQLQTSLDQKNNAHKNQLKNGLK